MGLDVCVAHLALFSLDFWLRKWLAVSLFWCVDPSVALWCSQTLGRLVSLGFIVCACGRTGRPVTFLIRMDKFWGAGLLVESVGRFGVVAGAPWPQLHSGALVLSMVSLYALSRLAVLR